MYIYIYTCVYVCSYALICIYVYIKTNVYIYIYMSQMYVCIYNMYTPGPFTVEVRTEKLVGLHGGHMRPIRGEKVKLGFRASKCRKPDPEFLTWN